MSVRFRVSMCMLVVAGWCVPVSPLMAQSIELDAIVVSGTSQRSIHDVARPVTVVDKAAIDEKAGSTLGVLLESLPGMANASFGAGVGRPVIRGMGGSRVKILQNGSDVADVSAMSSDHAPMADAGAARQIEVLYGPATLIYGGGAIGGVVNVEDERIHEQPLDSVNGSLGVKGSSVDEGYHVDASVDAGRGNWVLHLDGFDRDADHYRSGSEAGRSYRIANSDSQGQGGAVALSWADGQHGFVGGSVSFLDHDYGVPYTSGDPFRVQPKQVRYDLKGAWWPDLDGAWSWVEEWRSALSFSDYEHAETEPGLDVALFDQQSWEFQSHIRHAPMGEWQGSVGIQLAWQELALCHDHGGCSGIPSHEAPWDGSMGYNLQNRLLHGYHFSHDTPMPTTQTLQTGLFMVEQRDWKHGTLEVGARVDRVRVEADPDPVNLVWRQARSYYKDKTFTPVTLSAAATWVLDGQQRLGISLARAQRAPDTPALYWNGDHHATFSFQLDNPDLGIETAYTLDIDWLYQGDTNHWRVALYYYQFDDYLYNDLKSFADPFHGNAVYRHEQVDARFYGSEFSLRHELGNAWQVDAGADVVKAEQRDGQPLPRIPPASFLLALNWAQAGWQARLETRSVLSQHQVAATESRTAGFVFINASAGYRQTLKRGAIHWQLAVQNLMDEYALNHVSYLKQIAPLPGRNITLGARYRF